MKNKLTVFLALSLVLFVAIGCNFGGLIGSDKKQSKDSTSKSGDATSTGDKQTEAEPSGEVVKIGIPECDELATYINDNSEAIEGSIIARGLVYVYKNMIVENIKEGVGKMNDEEKAKMAKVCTKSLDDLKKSINK